MTTNKTEAKRYNMTTDKYYHPVPYETEHGQWVKYSSYKAMQAECDALRAKTSLSLGVGDGTGNLFVHGDYDSIKRVQALIFECEKLRKDAERYRKLRSTTWDASPLCVVVDPKHSVQLGSDCPSHKRLDDMVDNLHVTTP